MLSNHDPAIDAVYYASVDGSENRPLFQSQSNAIYGNGYLLYLRDGQLMARSFDPAKGTLSGEAQSVASGVMEDASTWHIDVSASNNGLLVFGSGVAGDGQLVWVDRNGKQIGTVADKIANLANARLSPQGTASRWRLTTVQARTTSGCSMWRGRSKRG